MPVAAFQEKSGEGGSGAEFAYCFRVGLEFSKYMNSCYVHQKYQWGLYEFGTTFNDERSTKKTHAGGSQGTFLEGWIISICRQR